MWGAMVEDWLDELLPDDADVVCRERVHLLVGAGGAPFDWYFETLCFGCEACSLQARRYGTAVIVVGI